MAHAEQNLAIFRGRLIFKSNVQKIWGVFILLSIITTVEVALGISKPVFLTKNSLFALKYLNWIFLVLTVVKAYYITWDFMHMRDEKMGLRRAVVWTGIFLICFLLFIVLLEGDYIFNVYSENYIKFDF
jgi:cytochrome c oxidase subunit IV